MSLNAPQDILKGGENGPVIEKGNAHGSELFKSLLLPLEDDNHMPPEGKPQLTKEDLWLIEFWINNNADFKEKAVSFPKNDTLNKLLKKYLVFNEVKINEASLSDINNVKDAGFSVLKLVPSKPELSVKFLKGDLTSDALKRLESLNEQIVELDLSNSELSDAMTSSFKKFKNLKKLTLSNTKITDASLKNFQKAKSLKTLNLYNTAITNTGLNDFLSEVVPEHIYVWKTEIDEAAIAMLESKFGTIIHKGVAADFVDMSNLEIPSFDSDKNLFVDTISLRLISKIKNVNTYYTIDGSEPDSTSIKFNNKIFLDKPLQIKARSYKEGWLPSEVFTKNFYSIKHKVSKFTLANQPDEKYPGANKLFDLKEGSGFLRDGNWIGFLGDNVDTTIDLETVKQINKISINCLEDVAQWILYPKKITIYSSQTSETSGFKKIGELKIKRKGKYGDGTAYKKYTVDIPNTKTQFLKVVVENYKTLPKWHEGAGNDSWLFVDEILVR